MFCKHCGEIIDDDSDFCRICGAEQTLSSEADGNYGTLIKGKLLKAGAFLMVTAGEVVKDVMVQQVASEGQKIVEQVTGQVGKSLQKKSKKVMHKALVGLKIEKPTTLEKMKMKKTINTKKVKGKK